MNTAKRTSVALGINSNHNSISNAANRKSAPYVFDTTGKVKGAVQL